MPIDHPTVLLRFGQNGRGFHTGLDIKKSQRGGDPVKASADGEVVEVGRRGHYGRQVLIRHADGWYTRYAHLRIVQVYTGKQVRAGETIGTIGQTGRATGPHLHFEILNPQKQPVDPEKYLLKVKDAPTGN